MTRKFSIWIVFSVIFCQSENSTNTDEYDPISQYSLNDTILKEFDASKSSREPLNAGQQEEAGREQAILSLPFFDSFSLLLLLQAAGLQSQDKPE